MPVPLEYRAALVADVAECLVLRGLTRQNAISAAGLARLGISAESWRASMQDGSLPGFVCLSGARIVGYCFGERATGEVAVLALVPEFEGQGIARKLLGLVMQALAGAGHTELFLGCSANPGSRSYGFYRHLGWRSLGRFDQRGDEILGYSLAANPPS